MIRRFICAAAAFLVVAGASAFDNPVVKGFFPDPSVCRAGDDYYLVNSSFQYFPGVPVLHSRDLVHWEQIGNVLDRDSQLRLPEARSWNGIYAPTIRYHEGMFYMITTNVSDRGNFIVHSEKPEGPWSEPAWVDVGGIDPSLFWDEDGTCWYSGTSDGWIRIAKIDPLTGQLLSEPKAISRGSGGRYPEAPHIYRKDGWYYLLIAEGGTEMGHGVCISRSRKIDGPYRQCPSNPILSNFNQNQQGNPVQGVGHADFVQAPDGSWWAVCLAYRRMGGDYHLLGRETFLAPVEWKKGKWPVINVDGSLSLEMPCEALRSVPLAAPKKAYDFTVDHRFGPEWVHMRNPHRDRYCFDAEGLHLVPGCGLDDSSDSPTFVARRQEDPCFEAVVKMRGSERGGGCGGHGGERCGGCGGAEFGITVFQDCFAHYDFFVRDGAVRVRYRLGSIEHFSEPVALSSLAGNHYCDVISAKTLRRGLYLKVSGSEYQYRFSASMDGEHWTEIGAGDTKWLSTEAAGGFTGIVLGLYATGSSDSRHCATITHFTYIEK